MGMTPDEYFTAFVLGNQEDCLANPTCLRRAFNAAVSASHLADHYYAYYLRHEPARVSDHRDINAFLSHVEAATEGAFRDIRSIANAYKHLYEDRRSGRPYRWSVSSGGSLESVEFEGRGRPLQSFEAGYHEDESLDNAVIFRRRDGTRGDFASALSTVVGYWERTLWGS